MRSAARPKESITEGRSGSVASIIVHKNRIIAGHGVIIPSEFSVLGRSRSFPICEDILRRLTIANSGVEISRELRDRIEEIMAWRRSLDVIKGRDDADGDSRLYPYQRVGVEWLLAIKRGILADPQGLGKTVMAAAACARLRRPLVIGIISTSSSIPSWSLHMREYFSDGIPWQDGRRGLATIDHEEHSNTIIVNQDNAGILRGYDIDVLIVDEAHHIRNRKTRAFKVIRGIARRVRYLFLLTATPTVNADYDIWTLLHLCDPARFSSYWNYVFRFFNVINSGFGMKIEGVRESEEEYLHDVISSYVLSRGEDVLDLPGIRRRRVSFILSEEHRALYDEMENKWMATLDGRSVSTSVKVAQITRLRQLAISPKLLFGGYLGRDKIGALVDIITARPGNVVVFTSFERVAVLARERLSRAAIPCEVLTGSTRDRDDVIHRFGSDFRVLVTTYGTGGESLTLTQAESAIFLDLAWHPAGNRHAMKRIHRIGQDREIEVIVIRSSGTIEEHVESIIRSKGRMSIDELMRRMRG